MAKKNIDDNTQSFSFVLKQIDLIEKSLRLLNKKEKKVDYDYDISLQIMPDPPSSQSFHFISVNIFAKGQERDFIATFKLGFVFEIPDLNNIAKVGDEGIVLPEDLLSLLNAVVIGTMRGVIFSELRGTQLDDAILPVLDPSKFQRNDNH